jgi:outer membrane immunogenic protein
MKKFMLAAIATAALAAPAIAADLPAKTYTKAPPPVIAPVYNWTGFYVGVNGGWGNTHKCVDDAGFVGAPLAVPVRDNCGDASGGLVGGQIGYNWQAGSWVFGIEAQGNWADLTGSAPSTRLAGISASAHVDGIGLFTGRVGYAWNNVLLYVKGGAAVTSDQYNAFITGTGVIVATASETRWGGAVGAGAEFGFAPNWSVGFEYNHLFLGREDIAFNAPAIAPLQPLQRIHQDADLVTVRVNYRFGGAAVVAKY